MKRREFITLLGGASVAWPVAARAQQERLRRIGVLNGGVENGTGSAAITALLEGLNKLGWIEGRNLKIDLRISSADPDRIRDGSVRIA